MKRRTFLSLAPAGIVAALSAGAKAASEKAGGGHHDSIGVLYDSTLCIGCRSCEASCQKAHSTILPEPEHYKIPEKPFYDRGVLETRRRVDFQRFTVVNRYEVEGRRPVHRKFQCNHCLTPACASACFVKALYKMPQGPVAYRHDLCVGCRYCMIACPFYVPAFDYDNALNPLIYKCTLCAPRIAEGLPPSCVSQCPEKALLLGKRMELLTIAKARIAESPEKYVRHIYGEEEVGGTSWLYLSPVPHEKLDQPVLGKAPAPDMTANILGAAAAAAGLLSVFLGAACFVSRRREMDAEKTRIEETDASAPGKEQRKTAGREGEQ